MAGRDLDEPGRAHFGGQHPDRGIACFSRGLDVEARKDLDKYLELKKDMKSALEQPIKYAKYQRDKKRKS